MTIHYWPYHCQPPEVEYVHIRSEVFYRFATTQVTSRVRNHANHTQDTMFEVFLPQQAFISNFTMYGLNKLVSHLNFSQISFCFTYDNLTIIP